MLDEKQISTESEIKEAITFDENFEDVSSLVENLEKFTPEELEGIPKIVLEVVPLTDDPSLPAFTFRYWVLATVFTVLGAFIGQMTWFRTSSAPFSMFFVQITSYWIGGLMAKVLPTSTFKVFGKEFSLNPGPFNTKEHVLIVVAVSSVAGAGSFAEIVISVKDLFYNEPMHPAAGVFLMLCSNLMGFSFAGFARQFLIFDPSMVWPITLMQTSVYRALHGDAYTNHHLRLFLIVCAGIFAWTFLPEYIFPFTSSLAVLCWFAPYNDTIKFIGSGLGGMGFMTFTLDWNNITSAIMLQPFWTQVIVFIASVLSLWVLVPIANFTGIWYGDQIPIMSQGLYDANGSAYPFQDLLDTTTNTLNQTAFKEHGLVYMATYFTWTLFFGYASFISAYVYVILFEGPRLKKVFARLFTREKRQDKDLLNKLMSAYDEVPVWWYLTLFGITFVIGLALVLFADIYLPWWCYIIGILFGGSTILPMGYVYAISNYQVAIGFFNELIFGYMSPGLHPVASLAYRVFAGNAWYQAQTLLQDQKLGHYMKVAPRATFFAQLYGAIVGSGINYATLVWVINTKRPYLDGTAQDPLNQWTGQTAKSYSNQAIIYGLIGPARLFQSARYTPLLWGFLLGAIAPIIIWLLNRRFPKAGFLFWNTTIFFDSMGNWQGYITAGNISSFIGGFVCMFYFFRYKHNVWKEYNYLIGAALDTGTNLAIMVIFIAFSGIATVSAPTWWGNDPNSVEHCYGSGSGN